MILMLHMFHTLYTLLRRQIWTGVSSARYSMVRQPVCLCTRSHSTARSTIPGIVIVLFFRCMKALLNPPNRARDGIKWGLVAHTVAMFSLATMSIGTGLNAMSISYVDNREFPGLGDIVPGPLGYTDLPKFHSVNAVSNSAVQLNQWLADGLLVSSAPKSVMQVSDLDHLSSYIVAILSMA